MNNMFVIEKMSKVLDMPYTDNWYNNLKILLWENIDLSDNNQDSIQLNNIITQLQYNLQAPQYDWNISEIKKLSIESFKKSCFHFPECSIQHAIEILKTLDLYTSK